MPGLDARPIQNSALRSSTTPWKTWKASGRPLCTISLTTGEICSGQHPELLHDKCLDRQQSRRDRSAQDPVSLATASVPTEQSVRLGQMLAAASGNEREMRDLPHFLNHPEELPVAAGRGRDHETRSPNATKPQETSLAFSYSTDKRWRSCSRVKACEAVEARIVGVAVQTLSTEFGCDIR